MMEFNIDKNYFKQTPKKIYIGSLILKQNFYIYFFYLLITYYLHYNYLSNNMYEFIYNYAVLLPVYTSSFE